MRWADPAACAANARAGWRRWRRFREALGLVHPGGRPRRLRTVLKMADEAGRQLSLAIGELERVLPAEVREGNTLPVTPAEALGKAAYVGLQRLYEIVSIPVTPEMVVEQTKVARLIGDMALGANKLFMRAAEGEFQARRTNAIEKLLEEIAAERREGTK